MSDLHLTFDDLPENLSSGLKEYLERTYPDTNITISLGYLERFSRLPPELLSKITRSKPEIRSSSHYITKELREKNMPDIYEIEGEYPISIKEKKEELEFNQSSILIASSKAEFVEGIAIYKWPFILKGTENDIILTGNPSVWCGVNSNRNRLNVKPINLQFEGISFKAVNLDIFSGHNIRRKRAICMEYNSNYANNYLIAMYNKLFTKNYETNTLTTKDLLDIFIFNSVAITLEEEVIDLRGTYDINENGDWNIIANKFISAYEEARNIIKKHVIKLTGSKISHEDSNKLVLL